MKEYAKNVQEVLRDLGAAQSGLSSEEAEKRIEKYGKNRLAEGKKTTLLQRFFKELADPMILILIAAAAVSGATAFYAGESFADVIIIMAVVVINAVLGVLQESKAEKAIEALQEIAAATSKVLRDGHIVTIKSEELTVGDIIVLEAGDAVPADGRLIECASLSAEEAALTGESVPVHKQTQEIAEDGGTEIPLGDRTNMVYMGSAVAYGRGKAVVTSVGMATEMGKIAHALSSAKEGQTPLQKKLTQLSRILSLLVLSICAVILAVDIFRAFPVITAQTLLSSVMTSVSLAVAAIPEGLAAVVTIVLSIGVTNMSKRGAVIRRLTAVETLGCAQVICSDKTGTLTQNRMTVTETFCDDEALLATAMALCSDAQADGEGRIVGEPTECALVEYAAKLRLPKEEIEKEYPRIAEAPFDSGRKRMSTIHALAEGGAVQFTKGAPDEMLKCCTQMYKDGVAIPMNEELRGEILQANAAMAGQALRVLCVAERRWETAPQDCSPQAIERELCYIGLVGMIDPVRPEAVEAVGRCAQAGIRAVMITGDHRDTAVAIAKNLGILESEEQATTGAQLNAMSDEELTEAVERYSVYARVQPEHKVRIVRAWQARGKVTAMTGDGVNDAPAIKGADIGVGMGITGTDVTKNAADMVLTDDNFATIVSAVEEGRRIYDNIRKSIQFLLSSNLSEVLSIFAATLLGFSILQPAHLLWINLITDCFPALALGMERQEADSMRRPPRDAGDGIFAGGMGFDILFQGIAISFVTLAAYFVGHYIEAGAFEAVNSADGTTMAFLTLSMAEVFHSFNMRSRRGSLFAANGHNLYLWAAGLLSLLCTTLVIYVPFLSEAFGFAHISAVEYAVALGLAALMLPLVEAVKAVQRLAA